MFQQTARVKKRRIVQLTRLEERGSNPKLSLPAGLDLLDSSPNREPDWIFGKEQ
jgi:hypothetical protein